MRYQTELASRAPLPAATDDASLRILREILAHERLSAVFQPIIDLGSGAIQGFEGLIRGPSNTPLQSPLALFGVAQRHGLNLELERVCRKVVIASFAAQDLPGRLFLNVDPECLLSPGFTRGETLRLLEAVDLSPDRIIIELTEHRPTLDYGVLRAATDHYREMGFTIAIDDLGEGFSGLRLWSELRPAFVKVDRHFVEGVNRDPVKLKFLESIQRIAEHAQSTVIAEGIETEAELLTVRELGIALGQGYVIARPTATPAATVPPDVTRMLVKPTSSAVRPNGPLLRATVGSLLLEAPAVSPATPSCEVQRLFTMHRDLPALPVVENEIPIGLINRYRFLELASQRFFFELHGRKPCRNLMDTQPLVVDRQMSIQELSHLVVTSDRRYLADGFIITEQGRYAGIGTGHDLVHRITELQITAARYANPLTLLPGNVPISEHTNRLLQSQIPFTIAYADLNAFKAFNDRYGYRQGDEVIQALARLLGKHSNPDKDFIGHIGGDDFIVLFQSSDWERRCHAVVAEFVQEVAPLLRAEDLANGGYVMEDRQGRPVFHPLVSVAIGCVEVVPGVFHTEHELADVAAEAKRAAKRAPDGVFVNRRRYTPRTPPPECDSET
ncbi:GGDEF domain-containing protein [Thiobacter aerophilum]|uniref:GGDEF domain-containing protein n=1 Tax=Thiobacter aerophilum TaxID=3121275 RepID=A0ABV0EGH3_9BURK